MLKVKDNRYVSFPERNTGSGSESVSDFWCGSKRNMDGRRAGSPLTRVNITLGYLSTKSDL